MRWMGWGWDDLADCPAEHVEVITEMMERESEQMRQAAGRRR